MTQHHDPQRGATVPAPPAELPRQIAILPLKSAVAFPGSVVPLAVGRPRSLELLDAEGASGGMIGFVLQRDAAVEEPGPSDLYPVGVTGAVVRMARTRDGSARIEARMHQRFRIMRLVGEAPYLRAEVEPVVDVVQDPATVEALRRSAIELFLEVTAADKGAAQEVGRVLGAIEDPARAVDLIAAGMPAPAHEKQEVLEEAVVDVRLRRVVDILTRERRIREIGREIQSGAAAEIEKRGREAYLREQLKVIQHELGHGGEPERLADDLGERIEGAGMPPEVEKVARAELERLRTIPAASPEHTVSRTYLDWLLALPWSAATPDQIDLEGARQILDEDHTGLEKVKDRILEFLAVVKLKGSVRGPILCLVGPPGVGKTSLGRSVARAMGRKFVRLSLGGVRDEAEIRGHRRTYIGSLPGRIVQGLRKAGTNNPVFLLDEVDKLGADFRGDPSAALLEVLDPEQNCTFSDHYLDVPFDLSRVLFIATANVLDAIPAPLRDRTEVIQLSGYAEEEKIAIARRHLLPKVLEQSGLSPDQATFTDAALRVIIRDYTRENGLRGLERELASVARKAARACAGGSTAAVHVDAPDVARFLGAPRFRRDEAERTSEVGLATGLAWTPNGGEILSIEATRMPGDRPLCLTGQLGDVMKESAQIALSHLRSRAAALGLPEDAFAHSEFHLHVPAGAVPKDGPSAGVTMVTALASLLLGRPVAADLAMTGEVTLRGRVLPIGGVREKVLAAARAGIKTVLLPAANAVDLDEVDASVLAQLTIRYAKTVDDVLDVALGLVPRRGARPGPVAAGTISEAAA